MLYGYINMNAVAMINNLCISKCYANTHTQCQLVLNNMKKIIKDNPSVITPNIIETFFNFMTNSSAYYSCCKRNPEDTRYVFNKLYNIITIKQSQIPAICIHNMYYLIVRAHEKGFVTHEHIELLFNYKSFESLCALGEVDAEFLLPFLHHVLRADIDLLAKKLFTTMKCLDIIPTHEDIKDAFDSNISDIHILVFDSGIELNKDILLLACSSRNIAAIKFLLNNKIEPDKECFDALVNQDPDKSFYDLIRYRQRSKEICSGVIDIFIIYGYNLTYDDVITATINKIKINDIEKFGFEFDEKYSEVCCQVGFNPYNKIIYNVKCLEYECARAGNLTIIKKIIKLGIKPNTKCVENACSLKSNLQTIKFLIDNGAILSLACIQNICNILGNKCINHVVNTYVNMINQKSIKVEKQNDADDADVDNDENDDKIVKKKKSKIDKKIIDISDDSDTKVIIKPLLKKNKIIVEVPTEEIDQRKKVNINPKLIKLFSLKKTEKFSFLEIRKKFLEYFSTNSLYHETHKSMIIFDKKLCDIFGIQKNKYLDFNDLDNFLIDMLN
jgi:hypothetical protein